MTLSAPQARTTLQADRAIAVHHLRKRYGKLDALKGINFEVRSGEIFGLIGPDGAGKTTTFQILAGVMAATAGEVSVLGTPPRQARLNLGYVTQKFSLYPDLSIEENMRYSAGLRRVPDAVFAERARPLLQRVDLERFRDRLAGQLSGGMKQKLALCCALVTQPKILLLDEPTTGVDPVSRREFWDLLAAVATEGVTVVAATPYLDEAERCHRIALIYAGEIQQIGTLKELRDSLGLQRIEVRAEPLTQAEAVLSERVQSVASEEPSSKSSPSENRPPRPPTLGETGQSPPALGDLGGHQPSAIVDIQTFGDRLDVLVTDAERGQTQIRSVLSQHGLTVRAMGQNDPTLENVFVNRLRQQGLDPAYLEFPAYRAGKEKGGLAIATQNLQKTFGDFQAVKGVDITVRYGEVYGLLGANGAGKTTVIKMLCGLLPASSGTVELAGETQNLNRSEVRSRIGYMSQKFTLYDDLTIRQNLEFYCGVYGVPKKARRDKIDWVLATCGLVGRENLITGSLPGGWKQRVSFGASVMHEPDILFLDEPTSGVDPLARRQFWRLIRDFARRGTAILVTTHYLEEAENCNNMAFMVAGEIVAQGSPSDIKTSQPGQLFELVSDQTQAASDLLKERLEPWRVAIFGDRLHLVLDHPDQELDTVRRWLADADIDIHTLHPAPFSLEDAFIGIVQRAAVS
ncbi:ATP-binding cassette domain-containing protein [Leptolyngbya iicbica]|uniref:ABC transporter ATP-binding protein n=2 Tax=Cyanophyceae TaxID=3028117 RepID=A0A4Q7E3H5_9CYAN|nr:ATP-binding cassette domain-containing protein [Leptolyngbya sp. LK]RZM76019.1 ABC transporter ATP-binding protein [Leptolyngbya sp. LK]